MDSLPFVADSSQAGQYIKMNNLQVSRKRGQGQIGTVGKSQKRDTIRNIYEGCFVWCVPQQDASWKDQGMYNSQ